MNASLNAGEVAVNFKILLPKLGGAYRDAADGGNVYEQVQWVDQAAFAGNLKFRLDGFSSDAPLRWQESTHVTHGRFTNWSIYKDDNDDWYLHIFRTSQIPNGNLLLQIEDPIMKSIAYAFQTFVTPPAQVRTPAVPQAINGRSVYELLPDTNVPRPEGDFGLFPPMHAGSHLFYNRRFTRYHYAAAAPITNVHATPIVTQRGDQYFIKVPDATWTDSTNLNSDARALEQDLRYRFNGLNDGSNYEFFQQLYEAVAPNGAMHYLNAEGHAGAYDGGNNNTWAADIVAAKLQAAISLEKIQAETPALSKWITANVYEHLTRLAVVSGSTSEDFFTGASIGETENIVNQQYIDDTRSLTEPKAIVNAEWDLNNDVLSVHFPDSTALVNWTQDNPLRHLREPLLLRAFWGGQAQKDFIIISVGDLIASGQPHGGTRLVTAMATGSTKNPAVATTLSGFIIGALGSVQRQIYIEDLRTATVVDNCDEHGDYDGSGYCRFRLLEGDRIISSEPISDSLQYFKSAAVTSNYGFTFKPETTNMNHAANILQSFSLIHDFSVSMDKRFDATGCSASPYGDIYYDCNGNITIHQMVGTAALRAGALQLELQPRDPSQKPVMAELPVGGSFECKLAFFKLNKKA